jgi:hypothetical protein
MTIRNTCSRKAHSSSPFAPTCTDHTSRGHTTWAAVLDLPTLSSRLRFLLCLAPLSLFSNLSWQKMRDFLVMDNTGFEQTTLLFTK